jgi:hypothetical protein
MVDPDPDFDSDFNFDINEAVRRLPKACVKRGPTAEG